MIVADNISKTFTIKERKIFKNSKVIKKNAVKNLNLTIEPGQIIGLLGINGAGKTTTIKMLTTMLEPTSGRIYVDNKDAIKEHLEVKRIINLISGGERNLYWRLSAKENLRYFGSLYGIESKLLNNRINDLMKLVGLSDNLDVPVENYSKGMKQRLQIARGLINDPRYIFLDEPTLGLDIIIAKEMRSYIKDLAKSRNKGILLTTHYIKEAEELCDYIYLIDKGQIIIEGTSHDIKSLYSKSLNYKIVVNDINDSFENELNCFLISQKAKFNFDKTAMEIDVHINGEVLPNVIDICNKHNIKLLKFLTIEPNLEDAIFSLLKEKEHKDVII